VSDKGYTFIDRQKLIEHLRKAKEDKKPKLVKRDKRHGM
jgi:hypothetical protein